ncbi:MAG: amidohydrolase/deacetylase family metallohydrolase, partial [Candidatus Latescibacteria bacterium]|nr:amidohydrolase/deacetylase family metallohydrolase [Candidatus Latescibacterota bacterium]
LDGIFDVGINGDKIAVVAEGIEGGKGVIDLSGRILTPGWIDIHAHLYEGSTTWGIRGDALCLATGVTTVVDAGSAGWANWLGFIDRVVGPARTQVLGYVHVSGIGLTYGPVGEMVDLRYGDVERTGFVAHYWREQCAGVKVRQGGFQVGDNGTAPLEMGIEAAAMAGVPVMVHIAKGVPVDVVMGLLRPGDIVTHCYQGTGDGVVDEGGKIVDSVWAARERGVLFDVGHGGGSFDYRIAIPALADGFVADVISTDLHSSSWERTVDSMPDAASKLLNLDVPLEKVVRQSSTAAAEALGRADDLGTLRVGTVADLAAFEVVSGDFEYRDVGGRTEKGDRKIVPALTVRAGMAYRPEDLYEELREDRERRDFMRKFMGKNFAALGWTPGESA